MSTRFTAFVKEQARKAQYAVTRKTPAEKAVLEATNDEKWGPSNTQMNEIARMCHNYKEADEVRRTLWGRIGDIEHVRYVQKSLLLLEYLLRNGPESIRSDTRQMIGQLQSLTSLHRFEVGEDAALEAVIRKKAEDIITMVNDNETYEMERQKASKLRSTLTSTSNVNDFGSYSQPTYGNSNYGYEDNTLPSRKTAPAPKKESSDEYEYDDIPTPTQKKNNNNQNQFNPFQSSQRQQPSQQPSQQQNFQNQNNNTFDPFNVQSKPQPPQQQNFQNQNNNTFDPFGFSQPNSGYQQNQGFQQQNQGFPQQNQGFQQQNLGFPQQNSGFQQQNQGFQQRNQGFPQQNQGFPQQNQGFPQQNQGFQQQNQGFQQQNLGFQQQNQSSLNADDFLFVAPAPPPQQKQQQQAPVNDFLDFSSVPSQPAQAPQNAPKQQPNNNMMDDFGGLVDFSLQAPKRDYGKAGNQVRGAGPTLGSK